MKRYLPFLLLLLFADVGPASAGRRAEARPTSEMQPAGFCEEWLQFSDGSAAVCTSDEATLFDVREP